jgi:threonine/homoserine/homoserine lactone efflux protein
MLDATQFAGFTGVVLLGAMSPGPDFAVVVRRAAASGRRHGMATALGVAVGVLGWVVAAAGGIAALLAASAVAFTVVKLVGAAYLCFLGLKSLRAATRATPTPVDAQGAEERGVRAAFSEGLLTNALNPKAGLFFVALVPQFVDHAAGPDVLVLSLIAAVGTACWFLLVANLVGALRRALARPAVCRTLDGLTGVALIGLGMRLALASRR